MKHFFGLLFSTLTIHFDMAGLICFEIGPWCLHLFVGRRAHWVWGYEGHWYDGPLPNWGLGPLFLLAAAIDPESWCYRCDKWPCSDWKRHRS